MLSGQCLNINIVINQPFLIHFGMHTSIGAGIARVNFQQGCNGQIPKGLKVMNKGKKAKLMQKEVWP